MKNPNLISEVFEKANLIQSVIDNTSSAFKMFREQTESITNELINHGGKNQSKQRFEFKNRGDLEFEMRFGGDVLIFLQHTNVFEFSRAHDVMKTPYIKEDSNRSFCGIINIYNFLRDSFEYNRENDLGYLIGRIFINSEGHYFIEGKREIGLLYNNFNTSIINEESVRDIIESAISYASKFDLLTPPYEEVKVVSVREMKENISNRLLITGKRLGFRFQEDKD